MQNSGILLVDDEPAYHAIVSAVLMCRTGTVDYSDNRGAAIDAVRSRPYDLILMDIEMPDGDGYRAVADVRAAAEWARVIPIIAFTTLRPSGGEQHFIDEGFDGWLAKPFEAGQLVQLVRRWLGGDEAASSAEDRGQQLAALLGAEAATAMIDRLYVSLEDAIEAIDGGADVRSYGHKLGGLSGTLGFAVLSAAWLSLQGGDSTAWPTVRKLTLEAIKRHRGA